MYLAVILCIIIIQEMRRTLSRRVALLEQQLFNIKMKLNVPLSKLELVERKTDPLQTIQMVCYYDTFCV